MDLFLGKPVTYWVALDQEVQRQGGLPKYKDLLRRAIAAEGKLALIRDSIDAAEDILREDTHGG